MAAQNDIYREDIMEIYKHPSNRGSLADPTVTQYENNPFCGDELTLQLKITGGNGQEKIVDAKYEGTACAVAIVSASMLTDSIIGKSVAQAKALTKQDLLDLIGINLTTSRVKCATLILEALQKALAKYEGLGN